MATWIGFVLVGLFVGSIYAEQAPIQELGLESSDLSSEVRSLQKNVTDLWTYIYQLRHAIEHHLTSLATRQSRLENTVRHQTMHSGGHDSHGHDHHTDDHSSHSESGHRHEPLTSSSDHHHHDEHGSSDHHHDDHGSADHHDDHGSPDHQHEDHSPSDHHHEDHSSSDHHHDDHHHHDSHSTSGDHLHGDDQHSHHSDYHDEHHHSSSDSHTHDHGNSTDSDHSKEHGHDDHHHHHGDEHHDSHEKVSHGDHQHSHEHKDSHEKDDKAADDQQQSVEDIEKPFTATVVRSHHHDHTVGTTDKTEENRSDPLNLLGSRDRHHHHHHHHHSHQDHAQQPYEAKVTIPKFSEYRQYTFATCDVQPNRVIATELQQEVKGQVSFWQKKTGGPLNVHVRLRGFSIGDHHGHQQEQQEQANEAPVHEAGHRHGFHVHEFADLSAGCQSTGPHYNPFTVQHGGPKSTTRHVGDLGNIECDDHGVTNIVFPDTVASLQGEYSIVGRALVIHSDVDDYGVNKDDPESLSTGNAGTRIACCVIQKVDKLPLATFKAIKLATNYQN